MSCSGGETFSRNPLTPTRSAAQPVAAGAAAQCGLSTFTRSVVLNHDRHGVGVVPHEAQLDLAGVVRRWTVSLLIAGVAGLMTIPVNLPLVTAGAVLVGFTPLALVGLRLVGRFRAGTL